MQFLTLDLIKTHCRISPDFTDDDVLLHRIGETAESIVQADLGRSLYSDLTNIDDVDGLLINPRHMTAMLLQVGHLYENREATISGATITNVPLAYEHLIQTDRLISV